MRQEKEGAGLRSLNGVAIAVWIMLTTAVSAMAAGPAYRLEVAGLACPFCAYGIEKKLTALDGVERVETNIKDGTVIVTMGDGGRLDEKTARQAVEDAGFTLDGFEPLGPGDSR